MREISIIKQNIIKYLDFKGISKYEFYQKTGASNGILSQKNGLSEDNILKFLSYYTDCSTEWLFCNIGDMIKPNINDSLPNETVRETVRFLDKTKNIKNLTLLNEVESPVYGKMPKIVTVDTSGKDNVVLVPVKAAAGYLLGYGDSGYIQSLPTFSLPNIQNGTFRMFQVSGHSMYPTISDGSYVVGEWVENWIKDIKDNRIYVIVCDNGILVKRVLNRLKKYENLYLKSDNRKEYPNVTLEPNQIKEVWAVKMHLSFDLPDPTVLYDRVGDLEAEIEYIKSTFKVKN